MEWDIIFMIWAMFGVAVYLLLDKFLSNTILGIMVLSNAVNLLLMQTSENPSDKRAPIIDDASLIPYADPLPQAMALTAIVIGFGLLSFFLILSYKLYHNMEEENLSVLFERKK